MHFETEDEKPEPPPNPSAGRYWAYFVAAVCFGIAGVSGYQDFENRWQVVAGVGAVGVVAALLGKLMSR